MTISLEKAGIEDAKALHAMQVKAFLPLLEKYQDTETNPASESLEKTLYRITDPLRGFYKILRDNILVGGIAIKHIAPKIIFLGPIFVDPAFRNQKIAQKALELIEGISPSIDFFELATILQETGNIYLYEKMGYVSTGEQKKINTSIDLVFYRKNLLHA
ncbi:MAG: GNAT family N-acetyltransferase [Chlamydiae bacterium]|nr:GNAT family N-acetyltransferase [Chlamydiota bacterium]